MKLLLTTLAALLPATATAAPLPQETPAPSRPWTLMIYGAADNNADGPILEFLDDIRKALDDDPGMELILFLDRSEHFSDDASVLGEDFTGARVYRLRKDSAERLDASAFFPGMTTDEEYEVDSADPENVARFVAFAKERFPARHYGLMIYSHADGCTMCPDEESGNDMHIPALTDWVDEAASVDFLALELCNMSGLEIAYQWRPGNGGFSADVLVAIPNAGPPLDWDRAFARIRSEGHATAVAASTEGADVRVDPNTMTPLAFGTLVIEEGHNGRRALLARNPEHVQRLQHEAAACLDLKQAKQAKKALDELARALASGKQREAFEALRDGAAPGLSEPVMNYVGNDFGRRPFVDTYALLARAAAATELSSKAREKAAAACAAVDALVVSSFGMDGLTGFENGKHGVFLVFPDGTATTRGTFGEVPTWSELGWYTPLAAESEGGAYGRWAFLEDGATPGDGIVDNWFELLDAWFDDTSSSPEGLNGYAY